MSMPPISSDLTAKRSVVFRLVAAGVPTGIVLIVAGYSFLPPLRGVETTIDRLLAGGRVIVLKPYRGSGRTQCKPNGCSDEPGADHKHRTVTLAISAHLARSSLNT